MAIIKLFVNFHGGSIVITKPGFTTSWSSSVIWSSRLASQCHGGRGCLPPFTVERMNSSFACLSQAMHQAIKRRASSLSAAATFRHSALILEFTSHPYLTIVTLGQNCKLAHVWKMSYNMMYTLVRKIAIYETCIQDFQEFFIEISEPRAGFLSNDTT